MIVTDAGGLSELVSDPKYVVPPKDASILADKIVDCLTNSRQLKDMSAGSREIAGKISWRKVAKQTVNIYHRVLNQKNMKTLHYGNDKRNFS
jgi:glycosyltransferase involved in cell wall biosynthesis